MSKPSYFAHNFLTVGCEHCESNAPRSHRHSEYDFRILSGSRHGFFHKTQFDPRRQRWYCSCEGGQAIDKALRRGEVLDPCVHMRAALHMIEKGWWVWPSVSEIDGPSCSYSPARWLIASEQDYELFDGDERPLVGEHGGLAAELERIGVKTARPSRLTLEEIFSAA